MQHAAVALRILTPRPTLSGTGNPDSLQNVNTTDLPDGALAYVLDINLAYRLHKTLVPPIVGTLTPASGPGVWVPEAGSAMFVDSAVASPGEVLSLAQLSQALLPAIPLEATDILFATSQPPVGGGAGEMPEGINIVPHINITATPGTVRVGLSFQNVTAAPITIPDGYTYYFIVYRPVR
jgi:hypothetical protein